MVSRTAHKNNKNVYHIDGEACGQTEVAAKMKSFGVDLDHKRFLILQVPLHIEHLFIISGRSGTDFANETKGL